MKWPDKEGTDGETEALMDLVINGWSWEWPGWRWVANQINSEYGNNRTPAACRNKFLYEEKKFVAA